MTVRDPNGRLSKKRKEAVLATILIFRVIYNLLPLLVAALLFGLYELRLRGAIFRRKP